MGIPILLLFLADIGGFLADVFRYIYYKIFLMGCLKRRPKTGPHVVKSKPMMANEPGYYHGRSIEVFSNSNPSPTSRGTEVKQRLIKPNSNPGPLNIQPLDETALANRSRTVRQRMDSQSSKEKLVVEEDWDDEDEKEWETINMVSVPVTVSMGIIALYIFGGGVLFSYWEEWDLLQACYFCFITVSTIGFGDVSPGRDFKDPTQNAILIIGSIYSLFGMAIITMCFSLMQEEIISKVKWFGKKMGIVDDDWTVVSVSLSSKVSFAH